MGSLAGAAGEWVDEEGLSTQDCAMQFGFEPPLGTVPALGQLEAVVTFGPSGPLRWTASPCAMHCHAGSMSCLSRQPVSHSLN